MAFSFSKANRFSSDKENKFLFIYSGHKSSTMCHQRLTKEPLHLDMATNMILQKSKLISMQSTLKPTS